MFDGGKLAVLIRVPAFTSAHIESSRKSLASSAHNSKRVCIAAFLRFKPWVPITVRERVFPPA
jgi:hypothetical protein